MHIRNARRREIRNLRKLQLVRRDQRAVADARVCARRRFDVFRNPAVQRYEQLSRGPSIIERVIQLLSAAARGRECGDAMRTTGIKIRANVGHHRRVFFPVDGRREQ